MSKPEKFSPYQIVVVILLALTQFTVILDFAIISPLGEILVKQLNISTSQFGIVVSAYAFSAAVSAIISAGFSDRFDRKKFLILMYTGFIAGTFFCGLATSFAHLLAARIVTGLFGGVMGSIVQTIVADLFKDQFRGRAMGFIQMAFAVGQIFGIPIGLFIATKTNWNNTFLMIVAISLINLLLIILKLKPITEHILLQKGENLIGKIFSIVKNPRYLTGLSAVAFISVGGFMMMPFMSLYIVNNLGIIRENIPIIFIASGFTNLIIMPVMGKLSDRFSRFNLFLIGTILAIIFINLFTHLPVTPLWLLIPINVLLFGSIMMRMTPFMAMNTSIPNIEDRGAYMSLSTAIQQAGGGLGSILGGYIVTQSTQATPLHQMDILGFIMTGIFALCLYLVYQLSLLINRN